MGQHYPKKWERPESWTAKNGNTLWPDVLLKKTRNAKVALEMFEEGGKAPRDHQVVKRHVVWGAKDGRF